jgi:YVTN family beta-propeller protein
MQDRYQVRKLLRSEATWNVYLVTDRTLERDCILKQQPLSGKTADRSAQLEQTATTLAKLRHPGLAMLMDFFTENDYFYVVLEYIRGQTLREIYANHVGSFNEKEVINWAIKLSEIVGYAHGEKVILGSISPDNVLLDEQGYLRITDFMVSNEDRVDGFTPPEQRQAKPVPQSNVFSIGALTYYLLTGYIPSSDSSEFPPIRKINPAVSKGLEAVLKKALQPDPTKRYSSADELGRALGRLISVNVEPSSVTPSDRKVRVETPYRVVPRPGRLISGIVVTVIGLLFILVLTSVAPFNKDPANYWVVPLATAVCAAPLLIPGVLLIRSGMAPEEPGQPPMRKVAKSWWLLPVALGFIGGLIAWAKNKTVNRSTALNMLILGIVLTLTWPSITGLIPVVTQKPLFSKANQSTASTPSPELTVLSTIKVGKLQKGIAVNPRTNRIYVPNWSDNTVSVIDGVTSTVIDTVKVGKSPSGAAVNDVTNWICVTNTADNTVSVIDGATNKIIDTVKVGKNPIDISVNPNTKRIYVSNIDDGTISVIEYVSVIAKDQSSAAENSLFQDDFNGSNSGWDEYCSPAVDYAFANGKYNVTVKKEDSIYFGEHVNMGEQDDFTVQVDTQELSGGSTSASGVVFRYLKYQDQSCYYVFWINSSKGTYSLKKRMLGVWSTLKDWTYSPHIKTGTDINRLKLTCAGTKISAYVNGTELCTASDDSFSKGYIGLAALDFNTHAWFDNFKLYTNKSNESYSDPLQASATPKNLFTVFKDDFSDPASGWGISKDRDVEYAYENGEYSIYINKVNWYFFTTNRHIANITDFTVEVDVNRLSKNTGEGAGLVLRRSKENNLNNCYFFMIKPGLVDGTTYYSFWKLKQGKWQSLIDWKTSGYIQSGGKTNRLKAVCHGPQIEIYANGYKLDMVNDNDFTAGQIGLFAQSTVLGDCHFHFDNFILYAGAFLDTASKPVPFESSPLAPNQQLSLSVSPSATSSGATLQISCAGLTPRTRASLRIVNNNDKSVVNQSSWIVDNSGKRVDDLITTGFTPGNYSVVISDAGLKSASATFTITEKP